ncbi:hypothetical protein [Nocardia sp. NPDC049707]|uniref:hypothetical protein n=1 Tax=Nocardia sp. NPDC049707 TaxID=3154735 RepID=UPI00341851CB
MAVLDVELSKLREVLAANGIAEISRETLRKILKAEGVTWQAVKTWKAGTDPEFTANMNRILDLFDHPPADGRVICVDEFGPLNLQPRAGRGWFRQRRPKRLRATYHHTRGVRHLLGALDLATGKIHCRIRDRKRWTEFLAFLKSLRARWPGLIEPLKNQYVQARASALEPKESLALIKQVEGELG